MAHHASRLLLQGHSAFFDHLVELVPARYYHDLDADRVSTKYMKRADRDAAQAFFRKQHKQVPRPAPPRTSPRRQMPPPGAAAPAAVSVPVSVCDLEGRVCGARNPRGRHRAHCQRGREAMQQAMRRRHKQRSPGAAFADEFSWYAWPGRERSSECAARCRTSATT